MKLFFITFCFVVFFAAISAQTQVMNLYKAKDGIEDARKWLTKNGMIEPLLILLATSTQEIEIGGNKIKIQVDFEAGKSQAWIYLFRDENDTSIIKGVVVIKTFFGAQVIEIPYKSLMPGNMNIDLNLSIEKYSYFDSDSASQKFKENSDFADYYNNTKPLDILSMALFISEEFGSGTPELQPYWGIIMVKNGNQKMCVSQAVSGDIFCSPDIINGVNDFNNSEKIISYPNPAEEFLNIDDIPSSDKYEVYDTFGRKVDVNYSLGGNSLRLNIGGLSSGVYYLRTSGDSILFIKK
jgi:hypothetical protein